MTNTLFRGILIGVAAGLTSGLVLHWIGVDVTPAVAAGSAAGAVGAVVAGSQKKAKSSADS